MHKIETMSGEEAGGRRGTEKSAAPRSCSKKKGTFMSAYETAQNTSPESCCSYI